MAWGAADFSGGMATKKANALWVVFLSQLVGLGFLTLLASVSAEPFPRGKLIVFASLAGIIGVAGLIALYSGLASGRMGIVAPLSAMIGALVPVLFGALIEGAPARIQMAGFCLALLAVWLVSWDKARWQVKPSELGFSCIAGVCFGFYFITIDQVSSQALFWPLATARLASVVLTGLVVLIYRPRPKPGFHKLPLLALVGVLDSTGNLFFALATRIGRLDVAVILSSLYPGVTVLLAYWLLHERLSTRQWIGVVFALVAVGIINIY